MNPKTSVNNNIERWGIFELALNGPTSGNPFTDVTLSAQFSYQNRVLEPDGFYDGANENGSANEDGSSGIYRIRFSPDTLGEWHYVTKSNVPELDGQRGVFTCVEATEGNHGPVKVADTFHFSYADGTPYYPFGTTCYAWVHQGDELEEQTLATLKEASFNKIRMCVFPKDYPFNKNEPVYYAFERDEAGDSDFTRFDPAFFHHFEQRLTQLLELGIEADIIIWHPYDRWGYAGMDEESDFRYLRYLIARLSAFRHVWWSLANEYDFMTKPMERWDRFFDILIEKDPYQRLRSIHNGNPKDMYDHTKPGVTHVCIQHSNIRQIMEWRDTYNKPIINDELEYEGNITYPWGGISAEEEVHRFWIMVANGGYAGHGETYMHPQDILWWAKGGVLHGESWKRIGFLREIIEASPAGGLSPQRGTEGNVFDDHGFASYYYWLRYSGGRVEDYFLVYLENYQPLRLPVWLAEGEYKIDIIDTWEMTITPAKVNKLSSQLPYAYDHSETLDPTHEIEMPGKPRIALRIQKAGV